MTKRIVDHETGEVVESSSANERHWRIVALRNQLEKNYLQLAEELYYFKNNKEYELLDHPSFASYLADPDVDLSERTAYRMIGVYERFVLQLPEVEEHKLIEAGISKLDTIRPYVVEENYPELLADAQALSRSDLKDRMEERFGSNGHHAKPTYEQKIRKIKRLIWAVQENATEEQKRHLKQAYEFVGLASSATVAEQ